MHNAIVTLYCHLGRKKVLRPYLRPAQITVARQTVDVKITTTDLTKPVYLTVGVGPSALQDAVGGIHRHRVALRKVKNRPAGADHVKNPVADADPVILLWNIKPCGSVLRFWNVGAVLDRSRRDATMQIGNRYRLEMMRGTRLTSATK